jgi:hypothetical protein
MTKGELIIRRVIVKEGEETRPEKGVSLIRHVPAPSVDPDRLWHGQQVDPEAVAAREVLEPARDAPPAG